MSYNFRPLVGFSMSSDRRSVGVQIKFFQKSHVTLPEPICKSLCNYYFLIEVVSFHGNLYSSTINLNYNEI